MSSSSNTSRKETERTKLIQEKCQTLLTQMLRDEDNKYCVDCDAKGPRWASWNLGVFLCIRCAGIHRNLGVHISRVKSVNLDTWTPEQVISLQQMGNSRARAVYEAQLPDGFRRPQTDTALESFVRAKYEHKKYLAREWVPPSPPKVDWAKEIDEELERQKRKKKSAQINSVLGIGGLNADRKGNTTTTNNNAKTVALPAPLPKPNSKNHGNNNNNHNNSSNSPQSHRNSHSTSDCNQVNSNSNDLLGLSSPTKPTATQAQQASADLVNDSFSNFLSATPNTPSNEANKKVENTLEQEEEDFFNQGSLGGMEKDKAGKLTKDSILALYGAAPTANTNPNLFAAQPQPSMFGMAPAYMGAAAGGAISHHPQQHQFMTPPNSTSMYNSPVMTAPTAFSAPGMSGMSPGSTVNNGLAFTAVRLNQSPLLAQVLCGGGVGGGAIMATGQQTAGVTNLMHTNQSLSGVNSMMGAAGNSMMGTANNNAGMMGMVGLGMPMGTSVFQNTATPAANGGSNTTGLNQQFGNLNIGNVWQ